ncbi:MAG: hypothetical protein ACRC6T_16245 [Sarcina sp.]
MGESITTEKGITTLDNLVVTDNRVLIGMTYKSDEVIPEDFDLERFNVTLPDTNGIFGVDVETKSEKIDDYTVIIMSDSKLIGGGLLKNNKMFVELELWGDILKEREPNIVYDGGAPVSLGKFEVRGELKDAMDEREVIKVDIDKGDKGSKSYENIRSLESNILGTIIYSESKKNFDDDMPSGEFGISLVVDGKEHSITGRLASQPTGRKRQDQYVFETVKVADIRKAKTIEIVVDEEVHKIK